MPVLLYADGTAHWSELRGETEHSVTSVLRETLNPTARQWGLGGGDLAHAFQRIAIRMVLRGHGGALRVTGASDPAKGARLSPVGVDIPAKRRFETPSRALADAFLNHEKVRWNKTPATPAQVRHLERGHASALDHVARLANVDGVVVMSTDLVVHGFGATIDVGSADPMPDEIDVYDPGASAAGTVKVASLNVGHRHKRGCDNPRSDNTHEGASSSSVVLSHTGAHIGS